MSSLAGIYLFLLGLASGIAFLTITSYRRVSPPWLKWVLIACGLFVMSRYVTMTLFAIAPTPQYVWPLRHCWFATSVGLTLPSIFALDQLLRHPAMSPAKLLRAFSPFLLIDAAVILFGTMRPTPDRIVGWTLHLSPAWQWVITGVQGAFVILFIGICVMLIRKVSSVPIRSALLGLLIAYIYLGVDGLILASGHWYFRPFLFSEMFALLAIWYTYDTSARLQQ